MDIASKPRRDGKRCKKLPGIWILLLTLPDGTRTTITSAEQVRTKK